MYRIDNSTAVTTIPTPGAVGPNPNGYFTDGNPASGIPATVVDDDWLNAVQEEIANAVESDGTVLSKTNRTQLKAKLTGRLLRRSLIVASATFTLLPGTQTWRALAQAAGGAGGGTQPTDGTHVQGSQGANGGDCVDATFSASGNSTLTLTLGPAGVGVAGASGGAGGNLTIVSGATTLIKAAGGNGGVMAPQGTGGAGLQPDADYNSVTSTVDASALFSIIYHGGCAGGPNINAGSATGAYAGGRGGSSHFGPGAPAKGNGQSAQNLGAGGGGSAVLTGAVSAFAGGNGGAPVCIIEEYS